LNLKDSGPTDNELDGIADLADLINHINEIDRLLKQANCILMFCQPKKPGKITLYFSKQEYAGGSRFGIKRRPRVVQWFRRVKDQSWYFVTLPAAHLVKRAKGKEEFGAAYHHTANALRTVAILLERRKELVEILRRLGQSLTNKKKRTGAVLGEINSNLQQAFLDHSVMRRSREPDANEWAWFNSAGQSHNPEAEELMPEYEGEYDDEDD